MRYLGLALTLVLFAACEDQSGPGRVAATVELDQQSLSLAEGSTVSLAARVLDQAGVAFEAGDRQAEVTWSSTDPAVASVAGGVVSAHSPGEARIRAQAGDAQAEVAVRVTAVATRLAAASPSDRSGVVGSTLTDPLAVRVLDRRGRGVEGISVAFAGAGSVTPGTVVTDAEGVARASWTLGGVAGEQRVRVTVDALPGDSVIFTATAAAGAASRIVKHSGDAQTAPVGTRLPQPLQARVTDAFGNGIQGVTVTWNAEAGSLASVTTLTDANGVVRASWTLGAAAGTQGVTASAVGQTARFTATAAADAPARVEVVSGSGQASAIGTALADTLVARVVDARGNPVAGVPVTWSVDTLGGTVSPLSATTAADGTVRARWMLGDTEGQFSARAQVAGLPAASFFARADPPEGVLEVRFTTTGTNLDPNGYTVAIDGTARASGVTESVRLRLLEDSYVLEIRDIAANCKLGGNNPREVEIERMVTTVVELTVTCVAPTPASSR